MSRDSYKCLWFLRDLCEQRQLQVPVVFERSMWYECGCFTVMNVGHLLCFRDMSLANLQYLSSEQALADLAQFITFAQTKYNLPNNKWIAIGGSYSGAVWLW